jgi:tetratricopeptide (TPR) repeat protein
MNESEIASPANKKSVGVRTACPSCGASVLSTDTFCAHCGSDLAPETKRSVKSSPSPAPPLSELSKAKFRGEQIAMLGIAFGLVMIFSALGYAGLTSGKKGFDLSGAAGAGAQPNSGAAAPPPATQNPSVNSRAPMLPPEALTKLDNLKKQIDIESSPQKKSSAALTLSDEYLSLGRLDLAGDYAEQAYTFTKDKVTLLRAANLYDDAKAYEKAAELYNTYLDIEPKNADARVDYAIALLNTGKQREGVTEMRQAVTDNPQHQKANLNLGILYAQIEKWKDAETLWKTAASIDPNSDAAKKANELLEKYQSKF